MVDKPNCSKRVMPTEEAIRKFWVDELWRKKGFDSKDEFLERGTCFACGMDGNERAHIKARSAGGSDDVSNIHILCGVCHKDSEYLDGGRYLSWVLSRTPLDMIMSASAKRGINLSQFLGASNG